MRRGRARERTELFINNMFGSKMMQIRRLVSVQTLTSSSAAHRFIVVAPNRRLQTSSVVTSTKRPVQVEKPTFYVSTLSPSFTQQRWLSTATATTAADSNFDAPPQAQDKAVSAWLFTCAALVFGMVIIGAITRLTESGLSIVDWRPITGVRFANASVFIVIKPILDTTAHNRRRVES
jgi:hypothetical protein